jgi:hypothetical protein
MLSDGENWNSLMYNTVDGSATDGGAMSRDTDQSRAAYFIVFSLVMGAVVLDLLVSVVRSTYRSLKAHADGRQYLTFGERKLLDNARVVLESVPLVHAPRRPADGAACGAALAHRAVHTDVFEMFTFGLVAGCTLALSLRHAPQSRDTDTRLGAVYYLFTAAFAAEVSLRVLADGLDLGARYGWNAFDAATTVTAVVGAALSLAADAGALPTDYGVMRVGLAVRALRLVAVIPFVRGAVPWFDALQPVIRSLRRASWRFTQLFGFFFGVVYMYAIIGMALFGNVRRGYSGDNMGGNPARSTGNLNAYSNFETFPVAFLTLFRSYTGENWNYIMTDLMVAPPYCVAADDASNTCGSAALAALFYIPFMFFCNFVFDAIIGATVLESFWVDNLSKNANAFPGWHEPAARRVYDFSHGAAIGFQDAWSYFDPHGDAPGVTIAQLEAIVAMVNEPLGARPHARDAAAQSVASGRARAAALVATLDLGPDRECITYHAALWALVMNASTDYGGRTLGRLVIERAVGDGGAASVLPLAGAPLAGVSIQSPDGASPGGGMPEANVPNLARSMRRISQAGLQHLNEAIESWRPQQATPSSVSAGGGGSARGPHARSLRRLSSSRRISTTGAGADAAATPLRSALSPRSALAHAAGESGDGALSPQAALSPAAGDGAFSPRGAAEAGGGAFSPRGALGAAAGSPRDETAVLVSAEPAGDTGAAAGGSSVTAERSDDLAYLLGEVDAAQRAPIK